MGRLTNMKKESDAEMEDFVLTKGDNYNTDSQPKYSVMPTSARHEVEEDDTQSSRRSSTVKSLTLPRPFSAVPMLARRSNNSITRPSIQEHGQAADELGQHDESENARTPGSNPRTTRTRLFAAGSSEAFSPCKQNQSSTLTPMAENLTIGNNLFSPDSSLSPSTTLSRSTSSSSASSNLAQSLSYLLSKAPSSADSTSTSSSGLSSIEPQRILIHSFTSSGSSSANSSASKDDDRRRASKLRKPYGIVSNPAQHQSFSNEVKPLCSRRRGRRQSGSKEYRSHITSPLFLSIDNPFSFDKEKDVDASDDEEANYSDAVHLAEDRVEKALFSSFEKDIKRSCNGRRRKVSTSRSSTSSGESPLSSSSFALLSRVSTERKVIRGDATAEEESDGEDGDRAHRFIKRCCSPSRRQSRSDNLFAGLSATNPGGIDSLNTSRGSEHDVDETLCQWRGNESRSSLSVDDRPHSPFSPPVLNSPGAKENIVPSSTPLLVLKATCLVGNASRNDGTLSTCSDATLSASIPTTKGNASLTRSQTLATSLRRNSNTSRSLFSSSNFTHTTSAPAGNSEEGTGQRVNTLRRRRSRPDAFASSSCELKDAGRPKPSLQASRSVQLDSVKVKEPALNGHHGLGSTLMRSHTVPLLAHRIGAGLASSSHDDFPVVKKVLPTIQSQRHPDLHVVSPATVAELLAGTYDGSISGYMIVDCRFAYEHKGGHVRRSMPIEDPEDLEKLFIRNRKDNSATTVLVFLCEFSANRAPKMVRHLRNLDRKIHFASYPQLFYPQLYLVDGGYKNVFEQRPDICEPRVYVSMKDARFTRQCKESFARLRSSWRKRKALDKTPFWNQDPSDPDVDGS